ncbi:MAG TPA: cyclodeaminase/cyclohydrolase family protein [Candidatus Dormibacteraeota bacterium]|nr:cyclodeaminase/cyclohydrolase family protein [Candidatus Dormibacteraeota bacterium]
MDGIDEYLERLASSDPVPGGGSAAALTAAVAAALVAMVGRIVSPPLDGLASDADRLRAELAKARRRDEAAYAAVIAAQALPKRDDAEKAARAGALEAALHGAAEAPLHAAELALDVLRLSDRLSEKPRGALASDVACAAEFARAAVAACAYNVRINHRYMRDDGVVREQAAALARIEQEASQIVERVRAAL